MTDLMIVIVCLFLGILVRFSIPFVLKIYSGQLILRQVDFRYILSAALSFMMGLGWEVTFKFTSLPSPEAYLYAFIFGIAGHEGLNWVVKGIEERKVNTEY